MSSKSKLILSLLSATAMLAIGAPVMVPAHAEEIVQTDRMDARLDELSLDASRFGVEMNDVNAALAPPTDTVDAKADTDPLANPFAASPEEPAKNASVAHDDVAKANPFEATPDSAKSVPDTKPADAQKVDDSALQFYAAHKDLKRFGAELRRLKALYPQWQPPSDLFSASVSIDEQPLWDIYALGDYAKVRAQIALLQSSNPQWKPSADLTNKLQTGEARALINRAFAQKRWQEVIDAAKANSGILVCNEMQVVWNVAEALAQTKNHAQSFELYKYVLANCDGPDLRLATVQKASLLLPSKGTEALIAMGRVEPDGGREFENFAFDGLRRQIGDYIKYGDFDASPSDDQLRQFVEFVQRKGSGPDAALIGWFFYTQEEWETANSWFLQAAKYQRSPKNIEGVVLTLRKMKQQARALKIAKRFAAGSGDIAEQYIEIVSSELTSETPELQIDRGDLAVFEKMVATRQSALGAQALGWKYLADGNKEAAGKWFADSVSWKATEGGVVGLAVMAARDKNGNALRALKEKYSKDYKALADFKVYKTKSKSKKSKKTDRVAAGAAPVKPKKTRRLFLLEG